MDFFTIYPTPEIIAQAEPADMARALLSAVRGQRFITDYVNVVRQRFQLADWQDPALIAVAEGWDWLERHGLLINDFSQSSGVHRVLSRRALRIADDDDFKAFRKEVQSVYDLLDEQCRSKVWPIYLRGDYDIAIAQAFKEVEVTMRDKAALKTSDFGERLIKKFFSKFRLPGTLAEGSDPNKQSDEERMLLGAFGVYRNPATHQPPTISDPTQAAEVLVFASHLLRLVRMSEEISASDA